MARQGVALPAVGRLVAAVGLYELVKGIRDAGTVLLSFVPVSVPEVFRTVRNAIRR
ncbi:hypothetical protein [Mycolicibacterium komossense]|uniref:Uncharacterized protein n=1 Tax=Mycolicibacterium komossense TaxID=1779 RepID=A0ABT3CE64_9MYCO|nr:hypothetical protein [Mycolicibacterium komossense]MCV7227766.1 hypothetical protein [Mycolicibacterium komossense]